MRISPEDQISYKGSPTIRSTRPRLVALSRNQRQRLLALTKRYNPDFDMKAFTAAQQYVNPNTFVGSERNFAQYGGIAPRILEGGD